MPGRKWYLVALLVALLGLGGAALYFFQRFAVIDAGVIRQAGVPPPVSPTPRQQTNHADEVASDIYFSIKNYHIPVYLMKILERSNLVLDSVQILPLLVLN